MIFTRFAEVGNEPLPVRTQNYWKIVIDWDCPSVPREVFARPTEIILTNRSTCPPRSEVVSPAQPFRTRLWLVRDSHYEKVRLRTGRDRFRIE